MAWRQRGGFSQDPANSPQYFLLIALNKGLAGIRRMTCHEIEIRASSQPIKVSSGADSIIRYLLIRDLD
ncbi:hypothetical protein CCGE531_12650 [Rhizobium sp. CCGE531]|nr:hypothetical protein CCGE531_12650 [Rhizobium sp. CCGE531]AYG73133.1 hypothetical protein CCGE532_12070 [Rhizobium sp. CCGE532]